MIKKTFVSIVALGAIIAGSANAAELSEASCKKSSKYVWVEAATNSDGGRGVCVKKNACDDDDYKHFCDKRFKDIQVCTSDVAEKLVRHAWGCNRTYKLDADNLTGQDYIACERITRGGMDYRVFEFDDTNETIDSTCARGGFDGACIAVGGDIMELDDTHVCRRGNESAVTFVPKTLSVTGGGEETKKFFEAILAIKNK